MGGVTISGDQECIGSDLNFVLLKILRREGRHWRGRVVVESECGQHGLARVVRVAGRDDTSKLRV